MTKIDEFLPLRSQETELIRNGQGFFFFNSYFIYLQLKKAQYGIQKLRLFPQFSVIVSSNIIPLKERNSQTDEVTIL